jgi:hypothetical protein
MLPATAGAPAGPPQRVQGLFVRDDQARAANPSGVVTGKAPSIPEKSGASAKADKKP